MAEAGSLSKQSHYANSRHLHQRKLVL